MNHIIVLLISGLFFIGCGSTKPVAYNVDSSLPLVGESGPSGSPGLQGEQGPTGAQGDSGLPGTSCTVSQVNHGALISCEDGSSVQVNGAYAVTLCTYTRHNHPVTQSAVCIDQNLYNSQFQLITLGFHYQSHHCQYNVVPNCGIQ